MKLSREQVLHIAELAKLALTEEEVELFAEQLSEILEYAERLNALDTEAIPPTAQPL
jgi:aspartyl-tRNA(Asn)/glutamyl-tRNA(Gln) amidotransferase subunit C